MTYSNWVMVEKSIGNSNKKEVILVSRIGLAAYQGALRIMDACERLSLKSACYSPLAGMVLRDKDSQEKDGLV